LRASSPPLLVHTNALGGYALHAASPDLAAPCNPLVLRMRAGAARCSALPWRLCPRRSCTPCLLVIWRSGWCLRCRYGCNSAARLGFDGVPRAGRDTLRMQVLWGVPHCPHAPCFLTAWRSGRSLLCRNGCRFVVGRVEGYGTRSYIPARGPEGCALAMAMAGRFLCATVLSAWPVQSLGARACTDMRLLRLQCLWESVAAWVPGPCCFGCGPCCFGWVHGFVRMPLWLGPCHLCLVRVIGSVHATLAGPCHVGSVHMLLWLSQRHACLLGGTPAMDL